MKTLRTKQMPRRNAYAECEKWRARAEAAEDLAERRMRGIDDLRIALETAIARAEKAEAVHEKLDRDLAATEAKMVLAEAERDAALARVRELEPLAKSTADHEMVLVRSSLEARIAELENQLAGLGFASDSATYPRWDLRAKDAEARIAELEEMVKTIEKVNQDQAVEIEELERRPAWGTHPRIAELEGALQQCAEALGPLWGDIAAGKAAEQRARAVLEKK